MSDGKRTGKKTASRKTGGGKTTPRLVQAAFVLLFFFAFSVFGLRYVERFVYDGPRDAAEAPAPETESAAERKIPPEPETAAPDDVPREEEAAGETGPKPRVVLVIDDLGNDRESVDRLVEMNFPLNMAVLPYLPHSDYAAREARENGMDVILHLPMEPKYSSGYTADDAGEGVLLVGYPISRLKEELRKNILALPGAVGVNNHMGSKFMENEKLVRIVMDELGARGFYFVDSLTTADSVGYRVARNLGVKVLRRDVFIDEADRGKDYTVKQIDRLVKIAEKNGMAVGIGHPYPQTIEALSQYLPEVAGRVEFVTISSVDIE